MYETVMSRLHGPLFRWDLKHMSHVLLLSMVLLHKAFSSTSHIGSKEPPTFPMRKIQQDRWNVPLFFLWGVEIASIGETPWDRVGGGRALSLWDVIFLIRGRFPVWFGQVIWTGLLEGWGRSEKKGGRGKFQLKFWQPSKWHTYQRTSEWMKHFVSNHTS